MLMPTTPLVAPEIGQTEIVIEGRSEDVRIASTRLVRSFNVLGLPALSMPCGFSTNGLPIGLQIVGAPFREARILRLAAAIEDSLGLAENPSLPA